MSEYDDGFDAGILHQCLQEREEDARREHKQRIAAFGAIRRAAEVMRGLQEECGSGWCYYDESSCTCVHMEIYQRLMRRAIRAAIGSDKA